MQEGLEDLESWKNKLRFKEQYFYPYEKFTRIIARNIYKKHGKDKAITYLADAIQNNSDYSQERKKSFLSESLIIIEDTKSGY